MREGGAPSLVRVVRMPGETWVSQSLDDGSLIDILLQRDGETPLFGAVHLARLARTGGTAGGRPNAATATLHDGTTLWVDPAPANCALTGRAATDGALVALRIVEEGRPGKLPRASGRIELRGRRLALVVGETGTRLSHRLTDRAARQVLSGRLSRLPGDLGAWLATRWAAGADDAALAAEAGSLAEIAAALRARARMAARPIELLPPRDPVEECLLERTTGGPLRIETNTGALKTRVDAILGRAALAEMAEVALDLALASPWSDPAIGGHLQEALGPTVGFPGGRLHVEPTQALTAIDVDGDPRQGFAQVNRRAAEAAMRQMRLRELGGIVVIDPAGPGIGQTAKAMIASLEKLAQADPYAVKTYPGGAGLVTLVRERRRPALAERLGGGGRVREGFVASAETSALMALSRAVAEAAQTRCGPEGLEVAPAVAQYLRETAAGRAALEEARQTTASPLALIERQGLEDGGTGLGTDGEGANG